MRPCPEGQDHLLEAFGLHRVQARGGLVQEQQAGGRGQGPGDFQQPFQAQGQDRRGLPGPVGQPHELQGLHGLGADVLFLGPGPGKLQGPGQEPGAAQAVAAHHDVFQDRHVVEELHQLEGAGDPPPGDAVGRASLDFLALKDDAALLGGQKAAHQVEQGGLAGAVGADDRLDGARRHPKGDLLHGLQAAEGQADVLQFQDTWFGQVIRLQLARSSFVRNSSRFM